MASFVPWNVAKKLRTAWKNRIEERQAKTAAMSFAACM
jgi:hypothetical protein